MKRTLMVALVGLVAMAGAGSAMAEESVWVSKDGEHHAVRGHSIFIGDDGDAFDLADLNDGETRIFGGGDSQVTVYRDGETATIHRAANAGKPELEITCQLKSDTCKVTTLEDDPERVMIMISRQRECVNDEGDCDPADLLADMQLDGVGHKVMIRKIVECDDDGDCSENVIHSAGGSGMVRIEKHGSGVGETEVIVLGQGGNWVGDDIGGNLMFISSDDKVALRCPEGDTTMRVDRKEADAVYLCPKHSQPLEKVERTHHGPHMIQVIETTDDASEY